MLLSFVPEGSFQAALKLTCPSQGLCGMHQSPVALARLVVREEFRAVGFKPFHHACVLAQKFLQMCDARGLVHVSAYCVPALIASV
jgi:hypothetical protein